jgi:hypothetical protein
VTVVVMSVSPRCVGPSRTLPESCRGARSGVLLLILPPDRRYER